MNLETRKTKLRLSRNRLKLVAVSLLFCLNNTEGLSQNTFLQINATANVGTKTNLNTDDPWESFSFVDIQLRCIHITQEDIILILWTSPFNQTVNGIIAYEKWNYTPYIFLSYTLLQNEFWLSVGASYKQEWRPVSFYVEWWLAWDNIFLLTWIALWLKLGN